MSIKSIENKFKWNLPQNYIYIRINLMCEKKKKNTQIKPNIFIRIKINLLGAKSAAWWVHRISTSAVVCALAICIWYIWSKWLGFQSLLSNCISRIARAFWLQCLCVCVFDWIFQFEWISIKCCQYVHLQIISSRVPSVAARSAHIAVSADVVAAAVATAVAAPNPNGFFFRTGQTCAVVI